MLRHSTILDKVEGTTFFFAPEMCKDDVDECTFEAFPLDIWALGITLYCLVYLELPFKSKNNDYSELIKNILTQEVIFPNTREVSIDLKELIRSMLHKDPEKRLTSKQLMNNDWLNKDRDCLKNSMKQDEIIKVSEEEIEQSLDFFLAGAKNRNYELMWKPRAQMTASALLNPLSKISNKSINNKIAISNKSINMGNMNISSKSINKDSPFKQKQNSNYFNNTSSTRLINKSGKNINQLKKVISEDEFFNN